MYLRPEFYDESQARSFDLNSLAKDAMLGDAFLAQDLLGSTATGLAGFAPSSTSSLAITIGAGRTYALAAADSSPVANGDLPSDSTLILHQGFNGPQSVVLSTAALAAGQSQWVLIEVGFSQTDAIAAGDPDNGLLSFFNSANWTSPLSGPGNNGQTLPTVRQEQVVLRAVYGTPATTGSEVPPNADAGFVGAYLVDLVYGQTSITLGEILTAGPSVGANVPSNYPAAPFLTGLLGTSPTATSSHHGGVAGQAAKINLATEVQGNLAATNLPLFTQALTTGTARNFGAADAYKLIRRSNSGTLMTDTFPGTSPGVLPAGTVIVVLNADASAPYIATPGAGAQLNGASGQAIVLGPGQRARFLSDGANYWTLDAPGRMRLGANMAFYADMASGADANIGLTATTGAWKTLQAAANWIADNVDLQGYVLTLNATGAFTAGVQIPNIVGLTGQPPSTTPTFELIFASGSSITATNSSCISVSGAGSSAYVGGHVTLAASGSSAGQGAALSAVNGGLLVYGGTGSALVFGVCAYAHLYAASGGILAADPRGGTNYTISGSAPNHALALWQGQIAMSNEGTVTVSGTPAFSTAFATAVDLGFITAAGITYSGSATGAYYLSTLNSVIDTNGGGSTYFPGNAGGTASTGRYN